MPEVTTADREQAARLVSAHPFRNLQFVDAIAAALAEARERHVADLERIDRGRITKSPAELGRLLRERIAELKGE